VTAFYNEIDPFAAAWLRELIKAGQIAHGVVDERSIEDINPTELVGYTQCHFFAGIGAWSYALRLAGWPDDRPVWTGSCPCQPFSAAGKGAGIADERHLWPAWYHLIAQLRPETVFGEQVANGLGLDWLDIVWPDMEAANYSFGAVDLCAAGVGAPHIRQRMYWVANANRAGQRPWGQGFQTMGHGQAAEPDSRSGRMGDAMPPGLPVRKPSGVEGAGGA
jgi:DNA (cytosine-5)-methyltransferase 1